MRAKRTPLSFWSPGSSVKEQIGAIYTEKLASRGFVVDRHAPQEWLTCAHKIPALVVTLEGEAVSCG